MARVAITQQSAHPYTVGLVRKSGDQNPIPFPYLWNDGVGNRTATMTVESNGALTFNNIPSDMVPVVVFEPGLSGLVYVTPADQTLKALRHGYEGDAATNVDSSGATLSTGIEAPVAPGSQELSTGRSCLALAVSLGDA